MLAGSQAGTRGAFLATIEFFSRSKLCDIFRSRTDAEPAGDKPFSFFFSVPGKDSIDRIEIRLQFLLRREAFVNVVATLIGVDAEQITITSVAATRRRRRRLDFLQKSQSHEALIRRALTFRYQHGTACWHYSPEKRAHQQRCNGVEAPRRRFPLEHAKRDRAAQ